MELLLKKLNLHQYIGTSQCLYLFDLTACSGVAERAAVDLATLSSSSKADLVELGFPIGVAAAIYKHLNTSAEVPGLQLIRQSQMSLHDKLGEGFFGTARRYLSYAVF